MAGVTLDWLHLLILLGAAQGIILAVALLARPRNRSANRLMAAAMLALSLYLLGEDYYWADLVARWPSFFGISYPLPWTFGPLIYLYALAASDRSRAFRPRDLVHFVPVAAIVVATLPIYLLDGAGKVALFERLKAGEAPTVLMMIEPTKYVSGLGYSLATVLYVRRHRRRIEDSYSNTEQVNLRWLMVLTSGAAAVWLIATSGVLARLVWPGTPEFGTLVALSVSVLLYANGYMGLRQPEVFRYETAEFPVPLGARTANPMLAEPPAIAPPDAAEPTDTGGAEATEARYERSGLSERDKQRLKEKLLALMDRDQPWKDSELTLADLAARVETSPHNLSEVLNADVGQTFYDFVNGYRVREVQRRIAAGDARAFKMLSLALDAGFASKSTFNDVFKKHTSLTPSAYRQTAGA